jgi:hypothetical protein
VELEATRRSEPWPIALGRRAVGSPSGFWLAAAAAFALRVALAASLPEAADTANYRRVAETLIGGGRLYADTPGIYPYPPLWSIAEVGALIVSRRLGLPFVAVVKMLPIVADAGVGAAIYLVARRSGADRCAARGLAAAYLLNPIAILISSVHGQFDSLALLFATLALLWLPRAGVGAGSALALGLAVALKSFPILLAPALALRAHRATSALLYGAGVLVPSALLLAPYLGRDPGPVLRELAAYSGETDQGWSVAYKIVLTSFVDLDTWLAYRAAALTVGKVAFLAASGALVLWLWLGRRSRRWSVERAVCWVLATFYALYPGLSSQYLLWILPFLILLRTSFTLGYSLAATAALATFYSAGHPEILGSPPWLAAVDHLTLRVVLSLSWWLVVVRWLAAELGQEIVAGRAGRSDSAADQPRR